LHCAFAAPRAAAVDETLKAKLASSRGAALFACALLTVATDWTSRSFGKDALSLPIATHSDYMEILVAHHAAAAAVHGRNMIATSVAQALTKRNWDGARGEGTYAVGDFVLVHRTAPNRMLPHFIGPYVVTEVGADKSFVWAQHYVDKTPTGRLGPVHVQRLVHFDASRATPEDVASFQVDVGSFIVEEVLGHRTVSDGSIEFHIRWRGNPITSWETAANVSKIVLVQDYRVEQGLGVKPALKAAPVARASAGGAGVSAGAATRSVSFALAGRGRGRGGGGAAGH
jgi:hypothetical protein